MALLYFQNIRILFIYKCQIDNSKLYGKTIHNKTMWKTQSFLCQIHFYGTSLTGAGITWDRNWIRIFSPRILFAHQVVLLLLLFILCSFPPTFYSKCKYIVNVVFFFILIYFNTYLLTGKLFILWVDATSHSDSKCQNFGDLQCIL